MVDDTAVRSLLETVLDPELPLINIVELGLVRSISTEGGSLVVTITPTYAGCPILEILKAEITQVLEQHGYEKVIVQTSLNPAWSTEWMADSAREKLREAGIAPPTGRSGTGGSDMGGLVQLPKVLTCPRCNQRTTREVSHFGSTACKSLWMCEHCKEPFEHFKDF